MDFQEKARGCLLGLAVGDALGQPTEGKTLDYIRSTYGKITDFLTEHPGVSDDTEYALFSSRLLLEHGLGMTSEHVARAWITSLAGQTGGFKGAGFSEMAAIENLRSGLMPPASGDHIHAWSDGLAMRVAPFGIVAPGKPALAADLAYRDGVVSHSGEGIYAGQAVAAAIATAMTLDSKNCGDVMNLLVQSALSVIPSDSWTARAITEAVAIGSGCADVWEALEPLYKGIVADYYYWSDLAPEAVGLAFGIIAAARGDFVDSVLGGTNIGRDTDTIAAIAGAITGAWLGVSSIPQEWGNPMKSVRGICIETVAGMHVLDTADALVKLIEGGNADGL
ncbi:MAG TPA: ADP-ribosylglycohydrolase family protein [Limnochordia bacterium]|nr:ADP-ribosylglycohydrolase family protein [Limnochordia bacterium]